MRGVSLQLSLLRTLDPALLPFPGVSLPSVPSPVSPHSGFREGDLSPLGWVLSWVLTPCPTAGMGHSATPSCHAQFCRAPSTTRHKLWVRWVGVCVPRPCSALGAPSAPPTPSAQCLLWVLLARVVPQRAQSIIPSPPHHPVPPRWRWGRRAGRLWFHPSAAPGSRFGSKALHQ